jgi:hypothetical protein
MYIVNSITVQFSGVQHIAAAWAAMHGMDMHSVEGDASLMSMYVSAHTTLRTFVTQSFHTTDCVQTLVLGSRGLFLHMLQPWMHVHLAALQGQ